jgi:hypothetical protein
MAPTATLVTPFAGAQGASVSPPVLRRRYTCDQTLSGSAATVTGDSGVPAKRSDDTLPVDRDDFAVRASEFRRRSNDRVDRLLGLGVIAGLATGWGLMSLADARGWPGNLQWVFFGAGWGLALIPVGVSRIRQFRMLRSLRLRCPACRKPLVDTFRMKARGEEVLATGECPSCGHTIFPKHGR